MEILLPASCKRLERKARPPFRRERQRNLLNLNTYKMNKITKPLTLHFKLINNSDTEQTATLFKGDKNLLANNHGNDKDVQVILLNSFGVYKILLADLAPNPALIKGVFLKANRNSIKITIVNGEDLTNNEKEFLVSTGFQNIEDFVISGDCGININLLPREEIELFLRVFRKVNKTNPLYGRDLVDEYLLQEKF